MFVDFSEAHREGKLLHSAVTLVRTIILEFLEGSHKVFHFFVGSGSILSTATNRIRHCTNSVLRSTDFIIPCILMCLGRLTIYGQKRTSIPSRLWNFDV